MRTSVYACSLLLGMVSLSIEAQNAALQSGFPTTLVAPGIDSPDSQVRISSPTLADLTGDGRPEIIVGTPDGVVWAVRSTGGVLWAFDTGDAPVESTAAVADIDLDGVPEVVVGAGSTLERPSAFGLRSENAGTLVVLRGDTGALKCRFTPKDHPGTVAGPEGVYSSPALAELDGNDGGQLEIAFGSWDFHIYALNHDCTIAWEKDEPDRVIDTTWSSPAIADLDRNGERDVVIGTDSHVEPQTPDTGDGGMVHAFRGGGVGSLAGFPRHFDEVIYSSPSIGDINADGNLDIVVGTGNCWERTTCAPPRPNHPVNERVFAFDRNGNDLAGWPFDLPDTEYVVGTVALADIDGEGTLESVFNTLPKNTSGADFTTPQKVYVVNANGAVRPGWPKQPGTPIDCGGATQSPASRGSPVVGNVLGDSRLEVVVGAGADVVIFDRDGTQLTRNGFCVGLTLKTNEPATIDSSVALGDLDGDGDVEVIAGAWRVVSGPTDTLRGTIHAWDLPGAIATGSLPWPMFRRTANGNARVDAATPTLFADGFE